jgi:hypothetical protein
MVMPMLELSHRSTVKRLASLFRSDQPTRPVLLLGAGASYRSGIALADTLVKNIARLGYAIEHFGSEPGGEFVSKAWAKGGLVPRVSQCRSLDLSELRPVEENDAWIGTVVVGEDRSHRVQIIYNGGVDPACFDEIGAGNRPVRFVWNGISRRQFVKGLAFLFGSDVALARKGQPDFGR